MRSEGAGRGRGSLDPVHLLVFHQRRRRNENVTRYMFMNKTTILHVQHSFSSFPDLSCTTTTLIFLLKIRRFEEDVSVKKLASF